MLEFYIGEMIDYLSNTKEDVDFNEMIDFYLKYKFQELSQMNRRSLARLMISEFNYQIRSELKSSEMLGFKVRVGDICYVDFGKAFITEAGYQHFALVIGYENSKALVVPMSSNYSMYSQSFCEKSFPNGKRHLYRLPAIAGLHKKSVLFLNDIKYINTARVISVKGNIGVNTRLFKDIVRRIAQLV